MRIVYRTLNDRMFDNKAEAIKYERKVELEELTDRNKLINLINIEDINEKLNNLSNAIVTLTITVDKMQKKLQLILDEYEFHIAALNDIM